MFGFVRDLITGVAKPSPDPNEAPTLAGATYKGRSRCGFHEYEWTSDGSTLVRIPAGPFWMGNGGNRQVVTLGSYYLARELVTVGQFRRFLECTDYESGKGFHQFAADLSDEYPALGINWHDAQAYCRWAGLRLPGEAEWEKAARGIDQRPFPWGKKWDEQLCSNLLNPEPNADKGAKKIKGTKGLLWRPGSSPQAASPYGILDLVGSAKQWCEDTFYENASAAPGVMSGQTGSAKKVVKGMSFTAMYQPGKPEFTCFWRSGREPRGQIIDTGLRLAYST